MTSALSEAKKLDTPTVETEKHQPELGADKIVQLPDGRTLIKGKLNGQDFLNFQDAIASSSTKGTKLSEGIKTVALKLFTWADGSKLTVDQLLDDNEDSVGFEGMRVISEHITALFTVGQTEET